MNTKATITLPVGGMDCVSCAAHDEEAVGTLPGVDTVQVLVAAERATVTYNPETTTRDQIVDAIHWAGYHVPHEAKLAAIETLALSQRMVGSVIGWGVLGLVALEKQKSRKRRCSVSRIHFRRIICPSC